MASQHSFFRESGNLALDLLNTEADTAEDQPDQLQSPTDLAGWLDATPLTAAPSRGLAPTSPPGWRRLLDEARQLRGHVARIVDALVGGKAPLPHDVFGINRVLTTSCRSKSLQFGDQGLRLVERETGASLRTVLVPVAHAAADLMSSADPERIRQCASPSCHRWFLDTSKGGRRKWCSMAECGNRAKAASHRRRLASA